MTSPTYASPYCIVNVIVTTTDFMSRKPLPKPPKNVHVVSVRLDEDTKAALEEFARKDERSVALYMRRVLRDHVERERAKVERKGG